MKKSSQKNPACPYCSNKPTIKIGKKKNKLRTTQRYLCKYCKRTFIDQPHSQKSKTHNLQTILNAISYYNLGHPLRKQNIPSSTLHNWIKQLKTELPFNRLRNKIKNKPLNQIIIKKQFIHHQQPFLYQYHSLKLNFAKKFPGLINYLKTINTSLPKKIFQNSERISAISKETPTTWVKSECRGKFGYVEVGEANETCQKCESISEHKVPNFPLRVGHFDEGKMTVFEPNVVVGVSKLNKENKNLIKKQNYATKLAEIALQITKDNKKRHNIIENFMLINDTATIATEIPIYLTKQETKTTNLTGHIDILQIRYHKLYILDFKPEPINKQQTINQLKLYREALSKRTNIKTNKIKLAFFNNKGYYEIN